jgi:hypothetical protein
MNEMNPRSVLGAGIFCFLGSFFFQEDFQQFVNFWLKTI